MTFKSNEPISPDQASDDAWLRRKVEEALRDRRPAIPGSKVNAYFKGAKSNFSGF